MVKQKIMLAVKNEEFLENIEWKLFHLLGDMIHLECVTENEYFRSRMDYLNSYDRIVADENFLFLIPKYEDISNLYYLTENQKSNDNKFGNEQNIILYDNLVEFICNGLEVNPEEQKTSAYAKNTIGMMVYSPAGGVGKTVTAMALAEQLSSQGYRTIYINTENLQSFHFYLENKSMINAIDFMKYITNQENSLYLDKKHIGQEEFDYLLPIDGILSALGISTGAYLSFVEQVMNSRVYDYIVFDTSSDLNETCIKLMEICSKVFLILNRNLLGEYETRNFAKYIHGTNQKFVFVQNRMNVQKTDFNLDGVGEKQCIYLPEMSEQTGKSLVHQLASCNIWKEYAERWMIM